MEIKPPKLDDRTSETIFDQTVDLAKHYCPDWTEGWLKIPDKEQVNDDPGLVIFRLFSKMTEHLVNQMNRIPEKHSIAFLDFMGVDLLPAKPSRVPLTFYLAKKASGARIPQGTKIAAKPTEEMIDSKVPEIVFETDRDLDVVPVKMSAVYSLNPWEDKYTDHSKDVAGKEDGFLIFGSDRSEKPLDHILYLGDDLLFDVRREAEITLKLYVDNLLSTNYFSIWSEGNLELEFDTIGGPIQARFPKFTPIGKSVINKEESFWISVKPMSGIEIQSPFNWEEILIGERKKFIDFLSWNFGADWEKATLSKNGNIIIHLGQKEIELEKDEINNIVTLTLRYVIPNKTYLFPLDKTADNKFYMHHQPVISRITADVSIGEILPEMAFYNDAPIDLKKGFFPFGEVPKKSDTLYIGSDEVFSKQGSTVVLNVTMKDNLTSNPNITAILIWEFWNGTNWEEINNEDNEESQPDREYENTTNDLKNSGTVEFICPSMKKVEINGKLNRWIRVRISEGDYGEPIKFVKDSVENIIKELDLEDSCESATIDKLEVKGYSFGYIESTLKSPFVISLLINYTYTNHLIQRIKSYNNFQFKDIKNAENFEPYEPSPEKLPALYLGFDKDESLKGKPISIFSPIKERLYKESMISIENPESQIDQITPEFLFSWDDVSGTDDARFRDFLFQKFGINSATITKIEKIDDSIKVSFNKKYLLLRLTDNKTQVNVDGRTDRFTARLEKGRLNIYTPEKVSGFVWEYYNGTEWEKFVPEDETDSFNKGGIVTFNINTNIAVKTEFEEDRYWIRIIPRVTNKISCPKLKGIFPNSVWAKNSTTVKDEILGSGNGQPGQTLYFSKKPVLKEQIIEVKEAGKPSDDEQKILRNELKVESEADVDLLREIKDEKTGEITETWVRWHQVDNFSLSGPLSRHYVLDRANGKIIFGDGKRGMLPPRGKKNILARKFNSGGSRWGNCKAETIDQLKRKIPGIEKVTNHISASGGMDQENLEKAVTRGPHSLKNRDRAVTKEDFEWLAREASQDVAWAKCNPEMGKINIIIVPDSTDYKPLPEAGLLDEVKRYLEDRALLTIKDRITTFGPDYKMINGTVEFKPEKLSESAAVSENIKEKLRTFLHPVHGGQDKDGWDFGEKIFLSDVAAVIGGIKGIKSIHEITLEKFEYLFNWEDIPGNDNEKLKEYLTRKYSIDWVKDANIIKIDENKIEVSHGDKKVIELKLIDARTKLILTIKGGEQTEKFIANPEKDKLNIFELKESKSGLGWITIEKDALPYAGHIEVIPEG